MIVMYITFKLAIEPTQKNIKLWCNIWTQCSDCISLVECNWGKKRTAKESWILISGIVYNLLRTGLSWNRSSHKLIYIYVRYCVSMHVYTQAHIYMGGRPFQAWEMWLSPLSEKPVGSEVGRQDPRPWISSPMGNQACFVPRLLWDLLLLKLPHPEAANVYWVSLSSWDLG